MYVQEKAMSRYNTSGEQTSSSTRELSKKVGRQGMAYSGCFFLSWSPWIVITFMQFAKAAVPPGVGVFASCMLPLQGMYKCFLYMLMNIFGSHFLISSGVTIYSSAFE